MESRVETVDYNIVAQSPTPLLHLRINIPTISSLNLASLSKYWHGIACFLNMLALTSMWKISVLFSINFLYIFVSIDHLFYQSICDTLCIYKYRQSLQFIIIRTAHPGDADSGYSSFLHLVRRRNLLVSCGEYGWAEASVFSQSSACTVWWAQTSGAHTLRGHKGGVHAVGQCRPLHTVEGQKSLTACGQWLS
jgi:hypothetical protein